MESIQGPGFDGFIMFYFVVLYGLALVNLAGLVYLIRRVELFRASLVVNPLATNSDGRTEKRYPPPPAQKLRPKFVSEEREADIAARLSDEVSRRDPIRR